MRVEFISLADLKQAAPSWAALCARAAEPNPFAEPDFLLPLLSYEKPRGLAFVAVWTSAESPPPPLWGAGEAGSHDRLAGETEAAPVPKDGEIVGRRFPSPRLRGEGWGEGA